VVVHVSDVAKKLVAELSSRFPSTDLMDALGIIYPQYWLDAETEQNFTRHLSIIKTTYGYPKKMNRKAITTLKKGKKSKASLLAIGNVVDLGASTSNPSVNCNDSTSSTNLTAILEVDPILSVANLDMQSSLFKLTMVSNAPLMMMKPFDLNPVTSMWRTIEENSYLRWSLSEFIKVAKIATVMVLGSVQDERTFSTVSFIKSKLRNRLTTHLPLVVGIKCQNFYNLQDFPYDAPFNSWHEEAQQQCDAS
jgi:hypothetical protein